VESLAVAQCPNHKRLNQFRRLTKLDAHSKCVMNSVCDLVVLQLY
jgi:hypothetical protein